MIGLLLGAGVAFFFSILVTPLAIRRLRQAEIGQFILEDVSGHAHKHGTPTMGGGVIVGACVLGFVAAHARVWTPEAGWGFSVRPFASQAWLAVFAMAGMAAIGLLDDLRKVRNARNRGLSKRWKFAGQLAIAGLFAAGAAEVGVHTEVSFTRSLGWKLGGLYLLWVLLAITATANAVNLTDGLDGLAAGASALVLGAFVIIGFWKFRNPDFYHLEGALDLALFAAAALGATLGFLWWNAAPAQIFMGDVGSHGLGGGMAALALLLDIHLLLVILGGLFVVETLSVILQVAGFRLFQRRLFRMAPIHHHFELTGWPEITVIVRFWILAALAAALGLGLFYADFISKTGGGS